MNRRRALAGLAAASAGAVGQASAQMDSKANAYLELTTWYLHNSAEDQPHRVASFLRDGLTPAITAAGGSLVGAFSNFIGPGGPSYLTVAQFASLAQTQQMIDGRRKQAAYQEAVSRLSSGPGAPFVRVENRVLRCFDFLPKVPAPAFPATQKLVELRTYESPSFAALERKVGMFNEGEAAIFTKLGFHPVFFGETVVGPGQPSLTYMLSYESLADRDRLWGEFMKDPEWQALRAKPGLSDAEIVSNISNVILQILKL